ncbi:NUP50 (Nucleoporin 50 kDa) protein [Rhynchospora pubera]|uniref:NUP50 (Nucleoporin 50 kDa) protein n=1 Tax=Rhynchospora pubera TaxID=906938 RepID=A0AAV8D439_9POAL|nr:NUP50 (Nucleoporin 50 kDa) protein [Rhynchospora pubera]
MADSKKRVAGRQLTRDDPDPDENETETEVGSFKKASEEVMATRRIVKVKRTLQQATPAANPFSGIRLVPPTANPTSQEPENENKNVGENKETQKIEDLNGDETNISQNGEVENGKGKEIEGENKNGGHSSVEMAEEDKKAKVDSTADISLAEVKEDDGSDSKEYVESKTESQKETGNEDESKAGEKEKTLGQTGSLSSFGQLSSGQNAFQGLAGTGFSTSSFSFGSGSTEGSAPISAFANAGPVFGSKPDSSLKEVPIETGEENEETVFTADVVLFEFLQGGWKERGKGEVKLNVPVSDNGKKPRLVMRTKGNYRLVLNASLYPDMALKDMDKRGVTFACLNSAGEGEAGSGLSTFALKFKEAGIRDDFCGVVSAHKGDKEKEEATAVLKNPENSPKESNE